MAALELDGFFASDWLTHGLEDAVGWGPSPDDEDTPDDIRAQRRSVKGRQPSPGWGIRVASSTAGMTGSHDTTAERAHSHLERRLRFKGSPPAEVIPMQNVKLRLDTWRDAERRLDGLALGSSEWQEAEDDVRQARKVFHAEVAQVSARYAEEELQGRSPWSARLDRRTSGAGDLVASAFLARFRQR